jgi:hypothetical protein
LVGNLAEIENDPDFGKKFAAAVRFRVTKSSKSYNINIDDPPLPGQVKIVSVGGADAAQLVLVTRNYGRLMGYYDTKAAIRPTLENEFRRAVTRDSKFGLRGDIISPTNQRPYGFMFFNPV